MRVRAGTRIRGRGLRGLRRREPPCRVESLRRLTAKQRADLVADLPRELADVVRDALAR